MAMFMVVMLSTGMSSCGGSDDEEDEYLGGGSQSALVDKLQGTWDIYSGTMSYEGMTITIDRNTFYRYKPANMEFWDATLKFNGNKVNGESYTLNGNQLLIDGMSIYDDITIVVKSVTDTKLILAEMLHSEDLDMTIDLEYHKR